MAEPDNSLDGVPRFGRNTKVVLNVDSEVPMVTGPQPELPAEADITPKSGMSIARPILEPVCEERAQPAPPSCVRVDRPVSPDTPDLFPLVRLI